MQDRVSSWAKDWRYANCATQPSDPPTNQSVPSLGSTGLFKVYLLRIAAPVTVAFWAPFKCTYLFTSFFTYCSCCGLLTSWCKGRDVESFISAVDQEQQPAVARSSASIGSIRQRRGLTDLQADYANVASKTFRFPVSAADDQQLIVLEYCAESRLTYSLPAQLLWVVSLVCG